MLPLAFSVCVRNTGNTGYSISVEVSANKLAKARRNEFLERPAKYRLIAGCPMKGLLPHVTVCTRTIPSSALMMMANIVVYA
jgi:hypothetical protein